VQGGEEMRRYAKRKKITPRVKIKGLYDKDLHCCARVLQSIMFAPTRKFDVEYGFDPFYACRYCKYSYSCMNSHVLFGGTRERLQALTGVDLGGSYDKRDPEKKFRHYLMQT